MAGNRTLAIIKPDAFSSGKTGLIIAHLEKAGFKIISSRVMKDDKDYGSIVPGQVADMILVDGKPAEHVADLRKVQTVIRAGRLYDVKDLRAAAGFGGR